MNTRFLVTILLCGFIASAHAADVAPQATSEKALVDLIRAGKTPPGADSKFEAAVRRIGDGGGLFSFDPAGNLIGVDLASDRVSAGDADIPFLLALPHLKKLRLSGSGVTNAGVRQISQITGLSELLLAGSKIDNAGLEQLAPLTNLASLTLRRSPKVTDEGLEHLKRFPKLTSLGLIEMGITDRGLDRVKELTQLRMIDLRGCSRIGNAGLQQLQTCKNLKTLRLGGYQVDNETLAILARFPSLKGLTIEEAAVANAGLARLVGLPLEEISMARCYGITDEAFVQFGKIATLGQLSVRGMPLRGRGLAHLRECGKLTVLRLNETGVNDAGVEHLRGLTSLVRLEVRQTPLTDAAIDTLSTLTGLKTLDIGQTRITDAGAKRLAKSLPHCDVKF